MSEFINSRLSKATRKSYSNAMKAFEKWYGKPISELLNEPDPSKTIEKYYIQLKQNHCQNTCRVKVNPLIQYLKYNNIQLNIRKQLGIYRTEITTRDHILTIDQCRSMWQIADLENKILIKTWLLGLRIGDASKLLWSDFDISPTDKPIEVLVLTKKEGIVAHCFIDSEFQKLLKKYIPNLDQNNEFLFQSARQNRLSEKQLLRRLQKLAHKAGVNTQKRFGWHIARKLFLRKAVELGLNQWSAKMMVGKAVDKSIATYINGVSLTKDAKKMSNVLRMRQTPQVTAKGEQYIEAMLDALRQLLKDKLTERGLTFTTTSTSDYENLYERLLPPQKRKEKVDF